MQRTFKTVFPQAAAKTPAASQPKPLDVRELAKVSGGLPRGDITRADDFVRHRDDRDPALASLLDDPAFDVTGLLPLQLEVRVQRHSESSF